MNIALTQNKRRPLRIKNRMTEKNIESLIKRLMLKHGAFRSTQEEWNKITVELNNELKEKGNFLIAK